MSFDKNQQWTCLNKPSGTERNLLSSIHCPYCLLGDVMTNWSSVLRSFDSSLSRRLPWMDSILFKKKNLLLPWLVSYKNSESSYVIIWSVYTGRTFLSGPICWHLAPLLLENQRLSSAWFLTHLLECQKCVSKKLLRDKWTVSYTRCHQLYTTTSFLEGFEQFTHSRVRPFRGFNPQVQSSDTIGFCEFVKHYV